MKPHSQQKFFEAKLIRFGLIGLNLSKFGQNLGEIWVKVIRVG